MKELCQTKDIVPRSQSVDVFSDVKGETNPERVIEILIQATKEEKIPWFRDADWYAVTYIPFLAVSFRLCLLNPRLLSTGLESTEGKARYLDVAFMDNKEIRLLASAYPKIHELARAVSSSFGGAKYKRDQNERLVWLEKAMRSYLPHVVSSSLDE